VYFVLWCLLIAVVVKIWPYSHMEEAGEHTSVDGSIDGGWRWQLCSIFWGIVPYEVGDNVHHYNREKQAWCPAEIVKKNRMRRGVQSYKLSYGEEESAAPDLTKVKADDLWPRGHWHGGKPLTFLVDAVIIVIAVWDFVMCTIVSELDQRDAHEMEELEEELGFFFKLLALVFEWKQCIAALNFVIILVITCLRVYAAGAHPHWSTYGGSATAMYMKGNFFLHVDILALTCEAVSLLLLPLAMQLDAWRLVGPLTRGYIERNLHKVSFLWFILVRALEMTSRRKLSQHSKSIGKKLAGSGQMFIAVGALGFMTWMAASTLFYAVNHSNPRAIWEAPFAHCPEGSNDWNRFESIPSSGFYTLLNLVKRQPLALPYNDTWRAYEARSDRLARCGGTRSMDAMCSGVFVNFRPRATVMLTNILLVPLFGLTAGIVGVVVFKLTAPSSQEELEDSSDSDSDDAGKSKKKESGEADEEDSGSESGSSSGGSSGSGSGSSESSGSASGSGSKAGSQVIGEDEEEEGTGVQPEWWVHPEGDKSSPFGDSLSGPYLELFTTISSFVPVLLYFLHTAVQAATDPQRSHYQNQNSLHVRIVFISFMWVDTSHLLVADIIASMFFTAELVARARDKIDVSMVGAVDVLAAATGFIHCVIFFCTGGDDCPWLDFAQALTVIRLFKLERYLLVFRDLGRVIHDNRRALLTTSIISGLALLTFSSMQYLSEQSNSDMRLRRKFLTLPRSIWMQVVTLNGEWVLADYTAWGKALSAIIVLVATSVFVIPMTILCSRFFLKMQEDSTSDKTAERMKPWQARRRHAALQENPETSWQRRAYKLMYANHLPKRDYNINKRGFQVMRGVSITLILLTTLVTLLSTLEEFDEYYRKLKETGSAEETAKHFAEAGSNAKDAFLVGNNFFTVEMYFWIFYFVDVVATVFFTAELVMRCLALGREHILSLFGIMEVLSLVAFYICLEPSKYRVDGLHPRYRHEGGKQALSTWDLLEDWIIPFRLLRLSCAEAYFPTSHIFTHMWKYSRRALVRSMYTLVCLWFVHASLLHMLETNNKQARQPERYRDVLTALQYTLVHITGDFPVMDYTLPSKLVLCSCLVFGTCALAGFTGMFAATFVKFMSAHLQSDRRRLRLEKAEKILDLVCALQRRWRFKVALKKAAEEDVRLHPEKAELWAQVEARKEEQRVKSLSSWRWRCRRVLINTKFQIFFGAVLMLSLTCAVLISIPQIGSIDRRWPSLKPLFITLRVLEYVCTAIFIFEYAVQLVAHGPRSALRFMRIVDAVVIIVPLVCRLLELHAKLQQANADHWSEEYIDYIDTLRDCCYCVIAMRVIRIMEWPCFRPYVAASLQLISLHSKCLPVPIFFALYLWVQTSLSFVWLEEFYDGPAKGYMRSIPEAMYWTSMFLIGEWPIVDFSPGAGSRVCIFICILGVLIFAIPTGIVVEAIQTALHDMMVSDDNGGRMLEKQFRDDCKEIEERRRAGKALDSDDEDDANNIADNDDDNEAWNNNNVVTNDMGFDNTVAGDSNELTNASNADMQEGNSNNAPVEDNTAAPNNALLSSSSTGPDNNAGRGSVGD